MGTQIIKLAENASETGEWKKWNGGPGEFTVVAASWANEVKLQYMGPEASAIDAGEHTTLADNGGGLFQIGPGFIRVAIEGSTGVYATAKGAGA